MFGKKGARRRDLVYHGTSIRYKDLIDMGTRIHLFGASGSGTTTLGAALARELNIFQVDVDDYYWKRTDPPYVQKNPPGQRIEAIRQALAGRQDWIISGSLVNWGQSLVDDCTLAVFVYLEPAQRMARLLQREQQRHGERIRPGGAMYEAHLEFIEWAASYETAKAPVRSLDMHEAWTGTLSCPVLRLDATHAVDSLVGQVQGVLSGLEVCRAIR